MRRSCAALAARVCLSTALVRRRRRASCMRSMCVTHSVFDGNDVHLDHLRWRQLGVLRRAVRHGVLHVRQRRHRVFADVLECGWLRFADGPVPDAHRVHGSCVGLERHVVQRVHQRHRWSLLEWRRLCTGALAVRASCASLIATVRTDDGVLVLCWCVDGGRHMRQCGLCESCCLQEGACVRCCAVCA